MMSRSGHVCAHSAPLAPEWNFCSQIVQALASAEIRTNGIRFDIAPSNSPSPPPDTERKHAGQHYRGRFAHDRQDKEQKRPTKTPPAHAIARFVRIHLQKPEDRQKIKQAGLSIF